MDAGIEKECSALGGLFQIIMNDMKASYPAWEDFVTKGAKLQSQLRATILVTGAFLDAFQKVADMATGTRGATKEIGSALTRMCMRHRSIESKLKLFTTSLSDSLISPLELKIEEWKKITSQLDKDHAKEYKKARADIKKKSSDTIKLQKKVKKGKGEARGQLDSALQDVNVRYAVLEETEKKAVVRALVEERSRFCGFVTLMKPVLDHEIGMLGEVTHLQTILEDLTNLTADPNKLPPSSEQVILDLKCSDFSYSYQTPPASPSNTLSRKSSISSTYQSGSVRHVPSLDSISYAMDGMRRSSPFLLIGQDEAGRSLSEGNSPSRRLGRRGGHGPAPQRRALLPGHVSRRDLATSDSLSGSTNQLASWSGQGGSGGAENGSLAPPHNAYTHHAERARAMSASGKSLQSCSAREQLALTLGVGGLNPDAPRSSRDSLHCSSGYSTQTTTPSCSEDTIPSHALKKEPLYVDYESISLHGGDGDSISLHHMRLHSNSSVGHQSDFDKSSTIPRNSDLSFQYRKLMQSKRPASTVSLLAEPERMVMHHSQSHTATIRRKPQSKPAYRRGTISGGVPIPICTPQVPLKATAPGGSEENVFVAPSCAGGGGLSAHAAAKLCTSTQSLSALPPSPYYQLVPGQMPIPVAVPTVPNFQEGGGGQQLQQRKYQQQQQHQQQQQQTQLSQQLNHHQQQQQQLNQQQLNLQQQACALQQLNQQQQQQLHHQQLQQQQQLNHQQQLHQQQYHLQQYQQPQQAVQHKTNQQHQFKEPHPPPPHYHHPHAHQPQSQPPPPQQPPAAAATMQGQSCSPEEPGLPQAPYPAPLPHTEEHEGGLERGGGGGEQAEEEVERERGPLDMVTLIRAVKLRRTVSNDRSAPFLPPPANHK